MKSYRVRVLFDSPIGFLTSVVYFNDFESSLLHARMSEDGHHPMWCIETLCNDGITLVARSSYDNMYGYTILHPRSFKVV